MCPILPCSHAYTNTLPVDSLPIYMFLRRSISPLPPQGDWRTKSPQETMAQPFPPKSPRDLTESGFCFRLKTRVAILSSVNSGVYPGQRRKFSGRPCNVHVPAGSSLLYLKSYLVYIDCLTQVANALSLSFAA